LLLRTCFSGCDNRRLWPVSIMRLPLFSDTRGGLVITTEHIHPNKSHGHCRGNKACSGKNVLSHGDPPLWLLPALLVCRVSSNRVTQDMGKTPGAAWGFYTKNETTARLGISPGPRHRGGNYQSWPQDGWNCRFSIADCRWTLEGVATPLLQSAISNRQ
jgi:hypothetical protein